MRNCMAAGMLAAAAAFGQVQPGAPRFEVASVKTVHENHTQGYRHQINPGGVTMYGVSLGYCIRLAYSLSWQHPWELVGPVWLDPPTDALVDVMARTGSPASEDQIRAMLQTLLIEKFKLQVHREKRSVPVFEMVVAGNTSALHHAAPGGEMKITSGPKMHEDHFRNISMEKFVLAMGPPQLSRPVVDRTGLVGEFDFTLDLGRYMTDPETGKLVVDAIGRVDTEGAIFRGLKDQLGLALKPGRGEFEVLVVDRAEKTPVEN